MQQIAPTLEQDRLAHLDVLRGAAILGILAVNMFAYALPGMAFSARGMWGDATAADTIAQGMVQFLFAGKFYPILALMFGVGMWMQLSKPREGSPLPGYAWRNLLLLGIGLAHAVFFFFGDILVVYALASLVAMCFWRAGDRVVLGVAIGLILMMGLCCMPAFAVLTHMGTMAPRTEGLQFPVTPAAAEAWAQGRDFAGMLPIFFGKFILPEGLAVHYAVFSEGSFLEILVLRLAFWAFMIINMAVSFFWQVIGLMLLGMWTARRGIWARPQEHRRLLLWTAGIGLGIGLPTQAIGAWEGNIDGQAIAMMAQGLFGPVLAAGYVAAFLLAWSSPAVRSATRPLAAVGRTALTNYLGQSIVFGTAFTAYGLGLFGQLGGLALVGLVVASWAVQIPLSMLWLKSFRMGPIEWLWRAASYRTLPPMRR